MRDVLIIEDDPTLRLGLKDNFEFKGYRVRTANDGEQGLNTSLDEQPDLIILDIMLPKISGYEVCSRIRKSNLDTFIIIVTGKSDEADIVQGLELGADDYMVKPFGIRELLARAEALMRRRKQLEPEVYEFGECQLDTKRGTFMRDGKKVPLTPGEFKMLHLLLRRSGCVLTRDEIFNTVWGYSRFISLSDVDRFVATLRKKIEPDPNNPTFICSVGEQSYKFETHGNDINN